MVKYGCNAAIFNEENLYRLLEKSQKDFFMFLVTKGLKDSGISLMHVVPNVWHRGMEGNKPYHSKEKLANMTKDGQRHGAKNPKNMTINTVMLWTRGLFLQY